MKDEAVSEVIGFIIIFGLVVTSITLVMYTGIPTLEEAQEREHVDNAQRAFSVLQDNVNDVALRDAPSRGTQVRVKGSELELESGSGEINVTAELASGENVSIGGAGFGAVLYRTGSGDSVVYENGAVFRFDGLNSSGIVYEPNWRVREDEVFIPIIKTVTSGGGSQSISGDSIMNVRASPDASTKRYLWEEVDTLHVNITSPRSDGWNVYLESFDAVDSTDITRSQDSVKLELSVERVIVVEDQIQMEIIS